MSAVEFIALASDWSRQYCVAICAFLVPTTLAVTITTLVLLVRVGSRERLQASALLASGLAVILALHVSTWLAIGVVTPVTFVLFSLGATCLVANAIAVWLHYYQPERAPQTARWVRQAVSTRWASRA